jgi:hypothetical protein
LAFENNEKKLSGESYVDQSFDLKVKDYVNKTGEWKQKTIEEPADFKAAKILEKAIEKAYPPI